MIEKSEIEKILSKYKNIRIATLCSHSALQIFHGARAEGIKTIGITTEKRKEVYKGFPLAKPDEFLHIPSFSDICELEEELVKRNAVLIPHGSLVEFCGKELENLCVPIFGNRWSLVWEKDRRKMFKWMKEAHLRTPRIFKPSEINMPCIVKFPGAKGGKGYIIVSSEKEFKKKTKNMELKGAIIQEYIIGVRFYFHYFYTPLFKIGYKAGEGRVELLSMDSRIETNIDEIYRLHSIGVQKTPSFVVAGNLPIIARESLLEKIFEIGKEVVNSSIKLFGGIPGPFCVETICDENLEFISFEISARIVAGTNLYPLGSPYSAYIFKKPVSTGRRIGMEIKYALKKNALGKIIY